MAEPRLFKSGFWKPALAGALLVCTSIGPAAAQRPDMNKICEQLAAYDEAGANFVPGVDVNGNPVAPADIEDSGGGQGIYDPVVIPITVDLSSRYAGKTSGLNLEPEVSWLEIYSDGRVLFNGEDIGPDIRTRCPLDNPALFPEQDGQNPADPLVSGDNNAQKNTNGDAQP